MTDYERYEEYQDSERGTAGVAVTFLLIGMGIGATTALLLAPKSGKQIRKNLRRHYQDARETMEDWSDQASDMVQRGGEWAKTAKKRVGPIAERMRH